MKPGLNAIANGLPVNGGRLDAAGIDYRLAREATLRAWRDGDLSRDQVCDAQRELTRNAEFCGEALGRPCPVCEDDELVEVTPDAIRLRKRFLKELDRRRAMRGHG